MMNALKFFENTIDFREHYFPGTAISPLTTRRKTVRFLADLKQFALNAYTTELQEKRPTGS